MSKKEVYKHKYHQKEKLNQRKLIVGIILILIISASISIFYIKNTNKTAKNFKIGNNSSNQEIVDYILNISSYETKIEVNMKSNKNENKYILKQKCIMNDVSIQEVIEPINISGVRIIKDKNNLKIENTKLSLSNIFENYQYISENELDLSSFIENYKLNENSKYEEENNNIKMKTTYKNINKILYINKENALPIKMELKDLNRNTTIYILYNEVTLNSLNRETILANQNINSIQSV